MPVYADHPYPLVKTPTYLARKDAEAPADFAPDMYQRVASEMACVHNLIIRGLNSIHLQAPHVQPADQNAFVRYSLEWCRFIHTHHGNEEKTFFPEVEKMAGEPGCMGGNVEQHAAFHPGMDEFRAYLESCLVKAAEYDGAKLVKLLDDFAPVLVEHLNEEIPSLLDLRRFGDDKMALLEKRLAEDGEHSMKELGLVTGMPWGFANHDVAYEDGLWAHWPPAPWAVQLLCKNVLHFLHTDMWKFSSCDRAGRMRPLYACPQEA